MLVLPEKPANQGERIRQVDCNRFDRLTRSFSTLLSRRTFASALGLGALSLPSLADAKKKHHRKHKKHKHKKKVKRNDFGCVNVGKFCKNNGQCCSGICQGKKGKKKCKAHDESTCQPGQDVCLGIEVECITTLGDSGACVRTTGNASYCFASGDCFPCTRDPDCESTFGAGAACIVCAECAITGNTACVGLSEIL
jgi:hypothetical protein